MQEFLARFIITCAKCVRTVKLSVLLLLIEVNSDFEVCFFVICVSRYQHQQNNVNPVVKKVYFFWICPDTNAFEWFTDLLQYLEERVSYSFFAIISSNREVIKCLRRMSLNEIARQEWT